MPNSIEEFEHWLGETGAIFCSLFSSNVVSLILNSKLCELRDLGGDGGDPLLRCVARLRLSNLDGYGFSNQKSWPLTITSLSKRSRIAP